MSSIAETLVNLASRAEAATQEAAGAGNATAKAEKEAKAAKAAFKALRKKKMKNGALYYEWYIICGVIGAGMLLYLFSIARAYYLRNKGAKARKNGSSSSIPPATTPLGQAKVSRLPAAMRAVFNNLAFVRVFPVYLFESSTAAEWFFTLAYTGIVIGLVFWGSFFRSVMNYSNACGIAAFGQVPLIIGLASRNNAISWLTGVSYEKLNYLHRAAGRVCCLLSWVHTMSWVQRGLAHDVMPGDPQFAAGVVGLAGLTIMLLTSFAFIRRVMYEAFIVIHIMFCLMFIIGVHFHWPKFGWWVYAGLIVWGADRFVGFARLIIFNIRFIIPFHSQKGNCTVELVSSKVVRLSFNRPSFTWGPGQHAFISTPSIAMLRYEQHPFTILNVPDEDGKVVFLVRAQKGFTSRLVQQIDTAAKTDLELASFIEGPYGISHNFNHFDSVILVAGGTGITYAASHLLSIIKESREGKSAVSHVRLVWNVRDGMHLSWIAPLLNSSLARGRGNLRVSIDVYITRSSASSEPATDGTHDPQPDPESPIVDTPCESNFVSPRTSSEGGSSADKTVIGKMGSEKTTDSEKLALAIGLNAETAAVTNFHYGRSHLEGILRLDVEASTRDAAGVAMAVCGPTALSLDARRAVSRVNSASAILRGQNSVELHTETFGW